MAATEIPQEQGQEGKDPIAGTKVEDKRPLLSKGVLSKTAQSWLLIGFASLVVLGLWFSGSATSPGKPGQSKNTGPGGQQPQQQVTGLSPDTVNAQIDAQEGRQYTAPRDGKHYDAEDNSTDRTDPYAGTNNPNTAPPQKSQEDLEREDTQKREYLSRYSSSFAVSYRDQLARANLSKKVTATEDGAVESAASGDGSDAIDQQIRALEAQQKQSLQQLQTQLGQQQSQQQRNESVAKPPEKKHIDVNSAIGADHIVFEGSVLETALINRLNGDSNGPVIVQVTGDYYSHDRQHVLIPAGTRVIGESKKVADTGQSRLAVVFHRLIMPDGYSVNLDIAPGLSQIGETSLKDQVNNHYFRIFGASIAVGAIGGLSSIGTNNSSVTGLPVSSGDAYRQGVSSSLSQSSIHILDKFLNILPTITIREGHRVKVYITQDFTVPAYENHTIKARL